MINKRHIWRLIIGLAAMLLLTTRTAAATDYGCLRFGAFFFDTSEIINLNTDARYTLQNLTDRIGGEQERVTADGSRVAYVRIDKPGEDLSKNIGTLLVSPLTVSPEPLVSTEVRTNLTLPNRFGGYFEFYDLQFAWSRDDKWLTYHWRDNKQEQKIGVADALGHEKFIATVPSRFRRIKAPQGNAYLDNASADSKYLSMLTEDGLLFWSIPDLKPIRPQFSKTTACLVDPESQFTLCAFWSPIGHYVAYGSFDRAGKLILVVADPEKAIPLLTFPLTRDATSYRFRWSPDGQHIIVNALYINDFDGTQKATLDIVGLDGTVQRKISDSVVIPSIGEGNAYALMTWCGNNSIRFAQRDGKVVAYFLSNHHSTTLSVASDEFEGTALNPPANCEYELVKPTEDYPFVGTLALATGQRRLLLKHDVDTLIWVNGLAVARWESAIAWMQPDGTNRHEINLDSQLTPLAWTPKSLWFVTSTEGVRNLYRADLNSGDYGLILSRPAEKTTVFQSPDKHFGLFSFENEKKARLSLIALDGQLQRDLPSFKMIEQIVWSAESQYFTIIEITDHDRVLHLFTRAGDEIRQYEHFPSGEFKWITCD